MTERKPKYYRGKNGDPGFRNILTPDHSSVRSLAWSALVSATRIRMRVEHNLKQAESNPKPNQE